MRRPLLVLVVVAACAVASSACGRSVRQPSPQPTVVRVVDGDTVVVHVGGRDESVRLIGIDTPESVKPDTPVQCFALEAAARTKALLPKGTRVRLEGDAELRDRYDRLLAYVYRADDGVFLKRVLAREAFALPYTFPDNVAHADALVAGAAEARASRRGLWNRCRDPDAPLDAALDRS